MPAKAKKIVKKKKIKTPKRKGEVPIVLKEKGGARKVIYVPRSIAVEVEQGLNLGSRLSIGTKGSRIVRAPAKKKKK